jgi:hypothetical protein
MVANTGSRNTMIGIWLPTYANTSKITIQNNIIQGFKYASVFAAGALSSKDYPGINQPMIDDFSLEKNIYYDNANLTPTPADSSGLPKNNYAFFTNIYTPTNFRQTNLVSNPLFVSIPNADFRLQSSSPAIGKGLPISWITEDYNGIPVTNPPNIGAFGKN